ncbi:MAG: SAM-dependent methyltransferase [Bacteroidales bacterium]|nr:SAM-dependent methyltransferase [Bacteroidales bacterium]
MAGKIFLIPVTLGGDDFHKVIPDKVIELIRLLRFFVVEDIRSARRYLRLIDKEFPINETVFFELNEHTGDADITQYLAPALSGSDIGVMSEAGLPCIADPGARIVSLAHQKNIIVTPLSGPSSIILALISSGFNGQNFTFNGYLPVKSAERSARLRELEKKASEGYTQIFMETPYRAQKMMESIIATCHNNTKLCIASDITLQSESIRTMKISEWKKNVPPLTDKLVIFVMQ